jgi:hypothetical protein
MPPLSTHSWTATWALAGTYCGCTGDPYYYDYGNDVTYQDNTVYYGDQPGRYAAVADRDALANDNIGIQQAIVADCDIVADDDARVHGPALEALAARGLASRAPCLPPSPSPRQTRDNDLAQARSVGVAGQIMPSGCLAMFYPVPKRFSAGHVLPGCP